MAANGRSNNGFNKYRAIVAQGGVMFSAAFSSAFAGVAGGSVGLGYVCPMTAQAALANGAGWAMVGDAVKIGGAYLIGQAGKLFAFVSPESAAAWVENARNIGIRERSLIAGIDPAAAVLWKARKREKLARIAGYVVNAAARQHDSERRAALLVEADLCLSKWA